MKSWHRIALGVLAALTPIAAVLAFHYSIYQNELRYDSWRFRAHAPPSAASELWVTYQPLINSPELLFVSILCGLIGLIIFRRFLLKRNASRSPGLPIAYQAAVDIGLLFWLGFLYSYEKTIFEHRHGINRMLHGALLYYGTSLIPAAILLIVYLSKKSVRHYQKLTEILFLAFVGPSFVLAPLMMCMVLLYILGIGLFIFLTPLLIKTAAVYALMSGVGEAFHGLGERPSKWRFGMALSLGAAAGVYARLLSVNPNPNLPPMQWSLIGINAVIGALYGLMSEIFFFYQPFNRKPPVY